MSLRVARIPYLNSVPFYRELPAEGLEMLDLPPRDLGRAAREGEVDAGILSMCDAFRCPDFEPLGDRGVAVNGPAHSVLLLSRRPPAELDGARIAVTTETSTSIRLLRVILAEAYGVTAELVRRDTAAPDDPAALLIGDRALRAAAGLGLVPGSAAYGPGAVALPDPERGWFWALDLAQAWKELTGGPFVFAEWCVRAGADPTGRAQLLARLEASLRWSLDNTAALGGIHGRAVGLDAGAAKAYLDGFTYRIGPREREAVAAFRSRVQELEPEMAAPLATAEVQP